MTAGPERLPGVAARRFWSAWAEVDLDAVAANVRVLRDLAAPAALCAVVKADGYGHGAVPVARAALGAGATWLAVALVEEGVVLREAGIRAPVLLLAEPPAEAMDEVVTHRLTGTLYTVGGADALAEAVSRHALSRPGRDPAGDQRLAVHIKVDTGMHRVGATVDGAVAVAESVRRSPDLVLEGLWTHFAVADDPDQGYTAEQVERFEAARRRFEQAGFAPTLVHAANSAATVAHPATHYDLVRCGISLYGYAAGPRLEGRAPLRPALSLKARVSQVKTLGAGERLSYGLRYRIGQESLVATVPIGYADGVPRRLSALGAEVLVGGRRCPIAGTVTMDHITVDCGPAADVKPGDEVVLLGRQGAEEITADDWARALDTISYEVLCGIGPRVPRVYV